MKQKKLMLLGGIRYLLPVIEAAHKLGVYVITADYLPDNIAHKYSDEYVNVSIIDHEAVLKDAAVQDKLYELRNFAIHGELSCTDVGSNAKMNELQALMGLECLKKIDDLIDYRKKVYAAYAEVLADCPFVKLLPFSQNKAYVPVLFKDFETRERVYNDLKDKCNVFSRRYFYPLLTDFAPYVYGKGSCPVAEDLASRVLTLPTYYGLPLEDVKAIAENVVEIVGGGK